MKSFGRRATIAVAAVACLAVLVGGWVLLIQPTRASISKTKAQTAQQVQDNQGAQLQLQTMRSIAKNLPAEKAELAALQKKVPNQVELPTDPALDAVPRYHFGRQADQHRAEHADCAGQCTGHLLGHGRVERERWLRRDRAVRQRAGRPAAHLHGVGLHVNRERQRDEQLVELVQFFERFVRQHPRQHHCQLDRARAGAHDRDGRTTSSTATGTSGH